MANSARALLVGLGVVLVASSAFAQTDEATTSASRSFREAKEAFARGDFTAAATAFEQAARTVPNAGVWLDAADAWERRGDLVKAAEDSDRALAIGRDDEAFRKEAEARLARVLPRVGTLDLRGERTITVTVDRSEPVMLPLRERVAPGTHHLVATDLVSNRTRAYDVEVNAGATREVTLELAPAPARVDTRTEPPPTIDHGVRTSRSKGPPAGAWVSLSVALALGVATGVAGALTVQAQSDYNAGPTLDGLDRFRTNRAVTNVLLGAGAVAAIVGVVWWVLAPRSIPQRLRATLSF